MVNWIITSGEIIGVVTAIFSAFVILRRDKSYVGNRFFAVSMVLFGFYAAFMFIFDLSLSENLLPWMMSSALCVVTFATTVFFLAFQIFMHSESFLRKKRIYLLWGLTFGIASLTFIVMPVFLNLDPPRVEKNKIVLIMMGGWQFLLHITNLVKLTIQIRRILEKDSKIRQKLINFRTAQFCGFLSPLVSVIAAFIPNEILFTFQFIFLAIGLSLIAITLSRKGK
ncbi:MAG: hypothetical protein ACTSYI_03415 [Promethearchaeota archaeon]